jgi:hypothetical protein
MSVALIGIEYLALEAGASSPRRLEASRQNFLPDIRRSTLVGTSKSLGILEVSMTSFARMVKGNAKIKCLFALPRKPSR